MVDHPQHPPGFSGRLLNTHPDLISKLPPRMPDATRFRHGFVRGRRHRAPNKLTRLNDRELFTVRVLLFRLNEHTVDRSDLFDGVKTTHSLPHLPRVGVY